MMRRLLCADLFAGAGGLSAGFHAAGFSSAFFNEVDANAAATYSANFPEAVALTCPVQELTPQEIIKRCPAAARLDVLCGGPPCQGFSINAPVRRASDPRNHLFRHYARLLAGLKPKFVVMENVPGLVSLDGGRTLASVKEAFAECGYRVSHKILNAAHYGVPQERWRLIIVGTSLRNVEPPIPVPAHYSTRSLNFSGGEHIFVTAVGAGRQAGLLPPATVGPALAGLPPIASGGGAQAIELPSGVTVYDHWCADMAAVNMQRMRHVPPGGSWRDIPRELLPEGMKKAKRSDHTRRYGRLHPGDVSSTIMTKCDPHWGTVVHPSQDRIISVRETARLQSFPDSFRFTGPMSSGYRQVGNAVPPLLAQAIAEGIAAVLRKRYRILR